MLKAVIVDDEVNGAKVLELQLKKYCPEVEIMDIAYSIKEAEKKISSLQPDVVFLDISMPVGNGFELLSRLKNRHFEVIFTTAYNEYAINAIRHNALDYLLKPIQKEELINAVRKCEEKKKKGTGDIKNIESIVTALSQTLKSTKLTVYTQEEILYIDTADIVRFEGDSNYTNIFLVKGEKILSSKTLNIYEKAVENLNFYRIHKKHLVNLSHVKKFTKADGGYLVMSDGSSLEVSQQKKLEILELLKM